MGRMSKNVANYPSIWVVVHKKGKGKGKGATKLQIRSMNWDELVAQDDAARKALLDMANGHKSWGREWYWENIADHMNFFDTAIEKLKELPPAENISKTISIIEELRIVTELLKAELATPSKASR